MTSSIVFTEVHFAPFSDAILIFDEAHNLESFCEDATSCTITTADIRDALRDINPLLPKLAKVPQETADRGTPLCTSELSVAHVTGRVATEYQAPASPTEESPVDVTSADFAAACSALAAVLRAIEVAVGALFCVCTPCQYFHFKYLCTVYFTVLLAQQNVKSCSFIVYTWTNVFLHPDRAPLGVAQPGRALYALFGGAGLTFANVARHVSCLDALASLLQDPPPPERLGVAARAAVRYYRLVSSFRCVGSSCTTVVTPRYRSA